MSHTNSADFNIIPGLLGHFESKSDPRQWNMTHLFLEEVSYTLMVAPLLYSGEEAVVKLFVDLVELRHFKEDGLDLWDGQDRLGRGGCGFQWFHGLRDKMRELFAITFI